MDTASILRKLRQIEEHARALAHELPQGHSQNRARLIWNLASHLAIDQELVQMREPRTTDGDTERPN